MSHLLVIRVQTQEEASRRQLLAPSVPTGEDFITLSLRDHHGDRGSHTATARVHCVAQVVQAPSRVTASAPSSGWAPHTVRGGQDVVRATWCSSRSSSHLVPDAAAPGRQPPCSHCTNACGVCLAGCAGLLSPHAALRAQALPLSRISPPTCRLPPGWCVCQILPDGDALTPQAAGEKQGPEFTRFRERSRAGFQMGRGHSCSGVSHDRADQVRNSQPGPASRPPGRDVSPRGPTSWL